MPHPAFPIALIAPALMLGTASALPAATNLPDPMEGVQTAQLTIHEPIIIRVPRMGAARSTVAATRLPVPQPIRWNEKKGPKCIAVAEIGGAIVSAPDAVDLVMTGGKRLRAHLNEDCGPIDFYNGFYLRPKADGKVCANRDVLRIRSGTSCGITRFKTLIAR